jgi:hypothetical protein
MVLTTPARLSTSIDASRLLDDHFHTTGTECDICKSAEPPSPAQEVVVVLTVCNHIFHEHCLRTWLTTQLNDTVHPRNATCPMCRHVLVINNSVTPSHLDTGRVSNSMDVAIAAMADTRRYFETTLGTGSQFAAGSPQSEQYQVLRQRLEENTAQMEEMVRMARELRETELDGGA